MSFLKNILKVVSFGSRTELENSYFLYNTFDTICVCMHLKILTVLLYHEKKEGQKEERKRNEGRREGQGRAKGRRGLITHTIATNSNLFHVWGDITWEAEKVVGLYQTHLVDRFRFSSCRWDLSPLFHTGTAFCALPLAQSVSLLSLLSSFPI